MKNKSIRILFQGDSVTDCGRSREIQEPNVNLGQGYVQMTAGRLLYENPDKKIEIFNRGIGGHRVVDLYARWKIDALNMKPDIISILVGVNDTWHEFAAKNGVDVARYAQIYRMILEWTLKELPNVKLVICEPFALKCGVVKEEWLAEINDRRKVAAALAKEFNALFIPFQAEFDKAAKLVRPEYWLVDGVHPTYAGHTLMSDFWLKSTGKLLFSGHLAQDASIVSVTSVGG